LVPVDNQPGVSVYTLDIFAVPYDELLNLLPKLAELAEAAGPTAYLGPEAS
jgi:hypothetical protein